MRKEARQAILIADLGNGDAGKGTITDYLATQLPVHTVVRYNGGAQAAHNVITSDGRHHTFAQFGSGTFVDGVRTHLSRFMKLDPISMLSEQRHLTELGVPDAFDRTSIEAKALIITPFQQAVNRLKESVRGSNRHGSCGMGIGETMSDYLRYGDAVLFAGDLADKNTTAKKLRFLRDVQLEKIRDLRMCQSGRKEWQLLDDKGVMPACIDIYDYFRSRVKIVDERYLGKLLSANGSVIFEGAQGVLLDELYGFYPYTTWSNTTFDNANTLLTENNFDGGQTRVGIMRAYATRHGAGPFVTEDAQLTKLIPDTHNITNPWQENFRVGYQDLVSLNYALEVLGGVDAIAVTCLDRLSGVPNWRVCTGYRAQEQDRNGDFFDLEGEVIKKIKVYRPTNIARQGDLTELLSVCTPVYQRCIGNNTSTYVSWIENQLQIPINILSFGPTRTDKRIVMSLHRKL